MDSSDPAFLFALLNNTDEVIFWLEKAWEERSVMMVTLKNYWVWDNLREEPRFIDLYNRMDFPRSIDHKETLSPIQIDTATSDERLLLEAKDVEQYIHKLNHLMTEEQIFTDPDLTLRMLAEKLELHPNKLSWLLNEQLGQNFNEYINSFRLARFKELALKPDKSHITLLRLAYESGFNSKSAFNAFFKKTMGKTPRKWRNEQKK